jgi:hypothetical protein
MARVHRSERGARRDPIARMCAQDRRNRKRDMHADEVLSL